MKKILALAVLVAFMGSLITSPALGAVKVGASCIKAGLTSTVSGKKYKCVKTGKKLVWDAGIVISNPATKPSSKPNSSINSTPLAPSTQSPSPSSTPEKILTPTNFSDLYENRKGIASAVWTKLNSKLNSTVQLPPVEIYRGPTTPIYVQDPSEYFKYVAQLFSGVSLPKKIIVFYWNHKDIDTIAAKALSVMGAENDLLYRAETTGPVVDCYTPTSCDVGHGFIGIDGNAYLGLGVPDTLEEVTGAGAGIGGVEVVEFYHSLELMPYRANALSIIGQKHNYLSANLPPFWMNQGSEGLMYFSLAYKNDLTGFIERAGRKSFEVDQNIPNFSLEWINNYLDISNLGNSWSDASYTNASAHRIMGYYLIQILVALKGPSVMLDFYDQMAQGKSFETIFQNLFGVTWNEAKPEIAKTIYDRYLNHY